MPIEKVIVLEDDQIVRKNLEQQLRQRRYDVAAVGTIAAAQDLLAKDNWDLVFVDVRLPDGEGTELLRQLQSRAQKPLVVITTGFGSVPSAVECMRGGAFDYLLKPYSNEQLEVTLSKAQKREHEAIEQQLFHLQAKRFETPQLAQEALAALGKKWKYHQVESSQLLEHKRYATKGRPTPKTPIKATEWQLQARVRPDVERLQQAKQSHACFVLGTNIKAEQLSDAEVIAGYKGQAHAEGGFRFLKDPLFFVSSLFKALEELPLPSST